METLGSDLALLALDPGNGRVRVESNLRYGLMGSELVRLAASGRIDIQADRIVVAGSAATTGDPQLDAALASIVAASRPPRPSVWVRRPRPQIVGSYLDGLQATGTIRRDGGGRRGRWRIADEAAAASVRARLDAIAFGSAGVDMAQAALAGLAHAIRLDHVLYPGRGNREVHRRLEQVAKGQWTSAAVQRAVGASSGASQQAAMTAANQAAINAATAAATQAAMDASIQAAISAATSSPPM